MEILQAGLVHQERTDLWAELPDATRAMFFWPMPGSPRTRNASMFSEQIDANTPAPQNFEVLVIRAIQAERLKLTEHPHERTRWRATTRWSAEALNP